MTIFNFLKIGILWRLRMGGKIFEEQSNNNQASWCYLSLISGTSPSSV